MMTSLIFFLLAPICSEAPWMMFVMRMGVPGATTRRSHDTAQRLLKHNALSSTSMTQHTHTHTGNVIQCLPGISFSKERTAYRENGAMELHKMHNHIISGLMMVISTS